jgi:hypothetical protein
MQASVRDRLIVEGHDVGEPDRDAEIDHFPRRRPRR